MVMHVIVTRIVSHLQMIVIYKRSLQLQELLKRRKVICNPKTRPAYLTGYGFVDYTV